MQLSGCLRRENVEPLERKREKRRLSEVEVRDEDRRGTGKSQERQRRRKFRYGSQIPTAAKGAGAEEGWFVPIHIPT